MRNVHGIERHGPRKRDSILPHLLPGGTAYQCFIEIERNYGKCNFNPGIHWKRQYKPH